MVQCEACRIVNVHDVSKKRMICAHNHHKLCNAHHNKNAAKHVIVADMLWHARTKRLAQKQFIEFVDDVVLNNMLYDPNVPKTCPNNG